MLLLALVLLPLLLLQHEVLLPPLLLHARAC
jgi:hypothetical protein